jgi:hypothetical protein
MQQTVSESGWKINGGVVQGTVGDIAVVIVPQYLPDTIDPHGPKAR